MATSKCALLVVLVLLVPFLPSAAPVDIVTSEGLIDSQDASLKWPPHSNPTRLLITPRNDQPLAQQVADQMACYDNTCEEIQWDPYLAYDALVADGFAVALDRREMERGLVFLAAYGAEVGAVAGDLIERPGGSERAARIGAGVSVASEIIRSGYLLQDESPETQRVVARYERNLRKWVRKYSACLTRMGYRVD
ncbi:MAG: hypothetical protein ACI9UK_002490 [Candidatus Krumholzibacteriia bacterium]|jgi:hypothetical protein